MEQRSPITPYSYASVCTQSISSKILQALQFRIFKIIGLLLLLITSSYSQSVSIAELSEANHPEFPDAKAMYIYNNSDVSFRFTRGESPEALYVIHKRIKIYTEDAFDMADFQLYMRKGYADEHIFDIDATVYNLSPNGTIKTDKLKKDNIYELKNQNYTSKKFALPNVKEGK